MLPYTTRACRVGANEQHTPCMIWPTITLSQLISYKPTIPTLRNHYSSYLPTTTTPSVYVRIPPLLFLPQFIVPFVPFLLPQLLVPSYRSYYHNSLYLPTAPTTTTPCTFLPLLHTTTCRLLSVKAILWYKELHSRVYRIGSTYDGTQWQHSQHPHPSRVEEVT